MDQAKSMKSIRKQEREQKEYFNKLAEKGESSPEPAVRNTIIDVQ